MGGARGFQAFCATIGLELEPFQRRIIRAALDHRETLVLLPRGNGKTTLFAAFALWHLLTVERPNVILAASSIAQARVAFDAAAHFAQHPAIAGPGLRVKSGYSEIWVGPGLPPDGKLKVISSDAPRAHGLQPSLVLIDELHAHRDDQLYVALRTALGKRRDARLVTITTAGHDRETALGRLRENALASPHITHRKSLTVAQDPAAGFCMFEWAVPEGADAEDAKVLKAANPATFVSRAFLDEQIHSPGIHPVDVARYHGNVWPDGHGEWLPAGAWQSCAGEATIEPGERVWLGVDVGGSRAASAVVMATADLRVQASIFEGDDSILEVIRHVEELAGIYEVVELAHDPWRFQQAALELAQAGMMVVQFPQTNERMVKASERLYAAIVEGDITHGDQPDLNRHVGTAIAKDTPRGWRLDKRRKEQQIDAVVAMAMAVERATAPTPKVELLGWL